MYKSERYIVGSMSNASFGHWGTPMFMMRRVNEEFTLYEIEQYIGAQFSGQELDIRFL